MSALEMASGKEPATDLFEVLTDDVRRRIVRILRDADGPISESTLAAQLADADDADAASPDRHRVRLRHVHLPKLAASGVVTWDRTEETVARAEQTSGDDDRIDRWLAEDDRRDTIAASLDDERSREIVRAAAAADGELDRRALARTLAARDADSAPSTQVVDDAATQLHHRHLPRLADRGLIEYDADAGTVTYAGPAAVAAMLRTVQ